MTACIDIDGTLTDWPCISKLACILHAVGWDIVFLTGGIAPDPASVDLAEWERQRREQIKPYELPKGYRIVCCPGRDGHEVAKAKAAFIASIKADLFMDDSTEYCRVARETSPGTLILQVIGK